MEAGDGLGGPPPGILLSPQLRRTPRSSGLGLRASYSSPTSTVISSGKPLYRSDSLQSFSAVGTKRVSPGRQGFLQSKAPSVASRILQFEPSNSPNSSRSNNGGVANNNGVGVANNNSSNGVAANNGMGVASSSSGGVSPTAPGGGGSTESKTETTSLVSDLKQSTGTVSFL